MLQAGFTNLHASVKSVPWVFASRDQIATFFKGLFGLDLEIDKIDEALDDYFNLYKLQKGDNESTSICVDWSLLYFVASKA